MRVRRTHTHALTHPHIHNHPHTRSHIHTHTHTQVRMIYSVLGGIHFRDGLRLYFKRHMYGNTVTADLWQAWQDASGIIIIIVDQN